jgi:hypothetical protein
MTDINARLEAHYNKAVEHFGEENVMGVFLYGSWNYNTSLPDSDVDTKCILVPNLRRLAIQPYKVTHLDVDGEVCECMSIMHMVANWKKQNINFVEIMFTDYCIINPLYQEVWYGYLSKEMRERVARYDIAAAVKSMSHQALHTMHQDPTDLKKLMNTARIANTLANLVTNRDRSYKDIIWQNENIRGIRTLKTPIPSNFIGDVEIYFESMIEHADDWGTTPWEKQALDEFLESFILDTIKYRMQSLQ